jgi:hypothetical protein
MTGTGTTEDADAARVAVDWARRSMPAEYSALLDALIEEARQDRGIGGLLLTGSLARMDALPGTDVDVRYLLRSEAPPVFERLTRDGLLLERSFTDEPAARKQLDDSPMHVYAYLDGCILHDPDGSLARLRTHAAEVYEGHRTPGHVRRRIADDLQHPESKIRVSLAGGDLRKAVFSLDTSSWQVIEGLWAANDRPVPPNSSVRPHLADLAGPDGIDAMFDRLFLADPRTRAETGLVLIRWIRERLVR